MCGDIRKSNTIDTVINLFCIHIKSLLSFTWLRQQPVRKV
uniref:Uncharacterized protein n=1 Tax=Siphoviridae sp. ctHjy10 TaxID=2826234 RepID=A0A8S5MBM9_9CAUD|nr:MAG TPA: hypothetical protein [Siphoviridae sp. ctHjy10]